MFNLVINLKNRQECIPFYSEWGAVQWAKHVGRYAEVDEATVIDKETGEIIVHYIRPERAWVEVSMKELENLLQSYSGLLSRMKERDGNEKLNQICEEIFRKDLTK